MTENKNFCIGSEKMIKDSELPADAKAVYYCLCSYRDKDNKAFPCRKTIIELLHIGKSNLSKCLQELTDAGYIEYSNRRENNRVASNVYTLTDCLSSVRVKNNKDFFMAKKIFDFPNGLKCCDYAVYALYTVFCSDDMLIRISDKEVRQKLDISAYSLRESKKRLVGAKIIKCSKDGYLLSDGIKRNGM